ncbi:MAG: alanine--glyoxylate aminotransferase family protein [Planctomycetes bacterium]|nr:alanine--glyoxylate aminotransferase family protein [Planctomycetota bacterium]
MAKKHYLFTPGPTPIPPEVSLAEAATLIHHRTPEFSKLFAQVSEDLKYLFQTKDGKVYTFASSGTGGMEACVANLLSKGDIALVIRGGKFGERWAELCEAYGVKTTCIDTEYGHAVRPEVIETALKGNKRFKAVFLTHCETSTGVLNDLETIAGIVKDHPALLVVDAVTTVGVSPFLMDKWQVDVAVTGSQKGFMMPPGLSFVAVRPPAWDAVKTADLPRYYWDFRAMDNALKKETTPFTPAISLIVALKTALDMIKKDGLENSWKQHARLAHATREAAKALGLKLFSRQPCDMLTAIRVPDGIDGTAFIKNLRDKYGVSIAGGQAEMKGKILRVTHVGYMNDFDILTAIAAIEKGLHDSGHPVDAGKGVATAQRLLIE